MAVLLSAEALPSSVRGMIHVPTHPGWHIVFDAAAWISAAALARLLYRWRLKDRIAEATAVVGPGYFIALGAGAVIGGYASGSLISLVGPAPTLSHSIAGVLAGAIIAVEAYKAARGIRTSTGAAFTGPLALGIAVGRWGCLFAGLPDGTYGAPTRLPWGVDLGDHIARHPVQVYESAAMAAFLVVYLLGLRARASWAMRRGFYVFCVWYGAQRLVWEALKPYPRLLWGLDLFQFIALGLIAYGWLLDARDRAAERSGAQERPLPVPRPDHEPV
jgi:hypothetical protein